MSLKSPLLAPTRPDLVWVAGPDTIRFLNDLISQEIGPVRPGAVRRSLLLTPRGRIEAVMWALRGEDLVGLVVEEGGGDDLAQSLSRYRIRVKADIEVASGPRWLVMGRYDRPPGSWSGGPESLVADVSWALVERTLLVGERPSLPEMDSAQYHRLRIESGEPLPGVDLDESTIPQETGLVATGVAFDKGCFVGQELVARLDSRGGRVNRHLRLMRLAGPGVEPGAPVLEGDEEVGRATSVAGDVALGMLHRRVSPGDTVTVAGVEAEVCELPQIPLARFTDS